MGKFVNTDTVTRIWPSIQEKDGSTLSLAPGASATLDLPDDFQDPYLKLVKPAKLKLVKPDNTAKADDKEPQQ